MNLTAPQFVGWCESHELFFPDSKTAVATPLTIVLQRALYLRNRHTDTGAHFICGDPHILSEVVTYLPGASILDLQNRKNETPLHWAAANGTLGFLPNAWLTDARLCTTDKRGWNVFHFAAAQGELCKMPRQLLKREPVFTPNGGGFTPLDLVRPKTLDMIIEHLGFKPESCIRYAEAIRRLAESRVPNGSFARFAANVEALTRLKHRERILDEDG